MAQTVKNQTGMRQTKMQSTINSIKDESQEYASASVSPAQKSPTKREDSDYVESSPEPRGKRQSEISSERNVASKTQSPTTSMMLKSPARQKSPKNDPIPSITP